MDELYRQLFNPQLYLVAYGRIYSNKGAMTPGPDAETADGMTLDKIGRIIDALRHERYRFKPVRRIYIPKKDGKTRPLGLPSWSDKLVGEVVRLLLEAYYEPQFSDRSHGFRPGRGCHTALRRGGVDLDRDDLVHRGRHLRVLRPARPSGHARRHWARRSTTTGCCGWSARCSRPDTWRTGSGTPRSAARRRAGLLSPILSNIYLDRLDTFVETVLLPEYNRGVRRKPNPELPQGAGANSPVLARVAIMPRCGRCASSNAACPSLDPCDPDYRRLRYVRYADDTLLGFTGPRPKLRRSSVASRQFLHDDLKLELSEDKDADHPRPHQRGAVPRLRDHRPARRPQASPLAAGRSTAGSRLRVPREVIKAKCARYMQRGKPGDGPS